MHPNSRTDLRRAPLTCKTSEGSDEVRDDMALMAIIGQFSVAAGAFSGSPAPLRKYYNNEISIEVPERREIHPAGLRWAQWWSGSQGRLESKGRSRVLRTGRWGGTVVVKGTPGQ
jgi:hypothetical protein